MSLLKNIPKNSLDTFSLQVRGAAQFSGSASSSSSPDRCMINSTCITISTMITSTYMTITMPMTISTMITSTCIFNSTMTTSTMTKTPSDQIHVRLCQHPWTVAWASSMQSNSVQLSAGTNTIVGQQLICQLLLIFSFLQWICLTLASTLYYPQQ